MRSILALTVVTFATTAWADPSFDVVPLVSDGAVAAPHTDPNLRNPWGLAAGSETPWWVANNATNTSTIYDGDGNAKPLVVKVDGSPTGELFNVTEGFKVCGGGQCVPAKFIWAGEDGVIAAWAPNLGTQASTVFTSPDGSVYKGIAQVTHFPRPQTIRFLYATDFHNGRVDIFDENFKRAPPSHELFHDRNLPRGYAPFGIKTLGDRVYVTYALQDDDKHDDVRGAGHGFVDEFDWQGFFIRRVASNGPLDSPWGISVAPGGVGPELADCLLIGNFGDGRINCYKFFPETGRYFFTDTLTQRHGDQIVIDGLWSLEPGNDGAAGSSGHLYFTAGTNGEADGLFGFIRRAHW
jgi:uncharacterized protein (TIGR03118 family)